jgi:hypothetical protein
MRVTFPAPGSRAQVALDQLPSRYEEFWMMPAALGEGLTATSRPYGYGRVDRSMLHRSIMEHGFYI